MEIHPRIRQRIRRNWIAKEAEIQGRRNSAVVKLNSVLGYLRGTNILSEVVDIDDLIAAIEKVRNEFTSYQIDVENPDSIRDAIAPHITEIHDKLKQLEDEHEAGPAIASDAKYGVNRASPRRS